MTDHFFWQGHITRMGYGDEDFMIYGITERWEGFVEKNQEAREKDHIEYLHTFVKSCFTHTHTHTPFNVCMLGTFSLLLYQIHVEKRKRNAQGGNKSVCESKFAPMPVIEHDLGFTVENWFVMQRYCTTS